VGVDRHGRSRDRYGRAAARHRQDRVAHGPTWAAHRSPVKHGAAKAIHGALDKGHADAYIRGTFQSSPMTRVAPPVAGRAKRKGDFVMTAAPLMPKATAVWLVENTALSFDQVAEFCKLHPLEVKAIADGDAAQGIKGLDPILTGQLTREEIEA